MEKIRLGILGVGNQGSMYAKKILGGECPEFELVSIADKNPARLEWIKENFTDKLNFYASLDEMLDSNTIDACLVEVPHYDHPSSAIACMRRGVHVCVDKPAGVYTKQIREMNEEAKKHDVVFAMMFNIIGYRTVEVANAGNYEVYNTFLMEKVVGYTPEGEAIKEFVEYGKIADSWGIVNNLIIAFGGEPISWINQESTIVSNYVVLVIYIVWNALPMKILILLGGLQSVNQQYYDAAKIDGTSPIRTFWCITVPLLSPMIAYTVITSFIGGFKEYSSIVGIFNEKMGPPGGDGRLNTIVGYIYDAIAGDKYGVASAAALILFGIILVVTLINLYVSSKKVHY